MTVLVKSNYIDEKTGLEMIPIPAGEFMYGKDNSSIELEEYWISKTPVTNEQYKRFIDENPAHPVPFDASVKVYNWDQDPTNRTYPIGKDKHPVVIVGWDDATAYCQWASMELPTEQEWEKAARGTDGRIYPWGNEWQENRCNTQDFWGNDKTNAITTPVGQFSPSGGDSPSGCVDMLGNVQEWTDNELVLRGGGLYSVGKNITLWFQNTNLPTNEHGNHTTGFRVVVRRQRTDKKTGLEMIHIPAGSFLSGKDKKSIKLEAYWISKTPVTNAQYKKFIDANPDYKVPNRIVKDPPITQDDYTQNYQAGSNTTYEPWNWDLVNRTYPAGKADHPVVNVSFDEIRAYCQWACMDLPTEQEWEKAARGTDGRIYPWGNQWQEKISNTPEYWESIGVDIEDYTQAARMGTTPVGKFSPQGDSPFGCVDTFGNALQYVYWITEDGELDGGLCGSPWNLSARGDTPFVGDKHWIRQHYPGPQACGFRVVRRSYADEKTGLEMLRNVLFCKHFQYR